MKEALEKIRARLETATPGPWGWIDNNHALVSKPTKLTHPFKYDHLIGAEVYSPYDKALIAHAPTDIDRLLRALEKCVEQRDHWVSVYGEDMCKKDGFMDRKLAPMNAELSRILGGEK